MEVKQKRKNLDAYLQDVKVKHQPRSLSAKDREMGGLHVYESAVLDQGMRRFQRVAEITVSHLESLQKLMTLLNEYVYKGSILTEKMLESKYDLPKSGEMRNVLGLLNRSKAAFHEYLMNYSAQTAIVGKSLNNLSILMTQINLFKRGEFEKNLSRGYDPIKIFHEIAKSPKNKALVAQFKTSFHEMERGFSMRDDLFRIITAITNDFIGFMDYIIKNKSFFLNSLDATVPTEFITFIDELIGIVKLLSELRNEIQKKDSIIKVNFVEDLRKNIKLFREQFGYDKDFYQSFVGGETDSISGYGTLTHATNEYQRLRRALDVEIQRLASEHGFIDSLSRFKAPALQVYSEPVVANLQLGISSQSAFIDAISIEIGLGQAELEECSKKTGEEIGKCVRKMSGMKTEKRTNTEAYIKIAEELAELDIENKNYLTIIKELGKILSEQGSKIGSDIMKKRVDQFNDIYLGFQRKTYDQLREYEGMRKNLIEYEKEVPVDDAEKQRLRALIINIEQRIKYLEKTIEKTSGEGQAGGGGGGGGGGAKTKKRGGGGGDFLDMNLSFSEPSYSKATIKKEVFDDFTESMIKEYAEHLYDPIKDIFIDILNLNVEGGGKYRGMKMDGGKYRGMKIEHPSFGSVEMGVGTQTDRLIHKFMMEGAKDPNIIAITDNISISGIVMKAINRVIDKIIAEFAENPQIDKEKLDKIKNIAESIKSASYRSFNEFIDIEKDKGDFEKKFKDFPILEDKKEEMIKMVKSIYDLQHKYFGGSGIVPEEREKLAIRYGTLAYTLFEKVKKYDYIFKYKTNMINDFDIVAFYRSIFKGFKKEDRKDSHDVKQIDDIERKLIKMSVKFSSKITKLYNIGYPKMEDQSNLNHLSGMLRDAIRNLKDIDNQKEQEEKLILIQKMIQQLFGHVFDAGYADKQIKAKSRKILEKALPLFRQLLTLTIPKENDRFILTFVRFFYTGIAIYDKVKRACDDRVLPEILTSTFKIEKEEEEDSVFLYMYNENDEFIIRFNIINNIGDPPLFSWYFNAKTEEFLH